MYDRSDLELKLNACANMPKSNLLDLVNILHKNLEEKLGGNIIAEALPLVNRTLEDIVGKNTTMTMGILEAVETKYDIAGMLNDYEEYLNKLTYSVQFKNDMHKEIVNEIKEERKPRTFSKVSRIISRVSESNTLYNPTYHKWEWYHTITDDINNVLNDKTLSKYEFDVEFISTDTMSIYQDDKFKVITVMYFKLTEYIPDEE